jgi:hypothetical protein
MILPSFILRQTANQQLKHSGIDSLKSCLDKEHFKNYPYEVDYQYNSRGYRDQEWPDDLTNVVWCIGDSFTVGLGSPRERTWPYLLENKLNQRTINVSMDGASNNWIARKTKDLFTEITPSLVILHWSYLHRREITTHSYVEDYINKEWVNFYNCVKDSSWPACDHRQDFKNLSESIQQEIWTKHYTTDLERWLNPNIATIVDDEHLRSFCSLDPKDGEIEDYNNTIECIESVESVKPAGTTIIHSFIPYFHGTKGNDPLMLRTMAHLELKEYTHTPLLEILDLARDSHHYDYKTAKKLVAMIVNLLP